MAASHQGTEEDDDALRPFPRSQRPRPSRLCRRQQSRLRRAERDLLGVLAQNAGRREPARSTILIWLSGGASHIDMWDLKPDAPVEYRGEFKPIATSAPGVFLCEHLPKLARQAHHLALINSLGHDGRGTGDHHAGYYYNLTGHAPDLSFHQLLNNRKPPPRNSAAPYGPTAVCKRRHSPCWRRRKPKGHSMSARNRRHCATAMAKRSTA